ncbi:uncharacterized protein CCOS01_01304 [Colletotrichum costaricense]|uniref:Uncharacterized protein n=1 Tax=Colletotrichum costaricense TaxID=1209916 RepID=A0AAI9ZAQ2_9PEZI|nr:uncharacterized protein CCOS01_01304 [Colletotrichum costaricense]KAI3545448.1 hypothetical protein CSPX01_05092 [Colletotrichum filicis]KAK1539990.1 hypothetical protein CCOS01_01304 [Colletotrichum costaricense]
MSTSEIPRLMRRPPGFHLNFVRTIYTADETALAKQTAPALLHVQRSAPEKKTLFGICATCSLVTTRSDQPSSSPDNRSHSPSSKDPYWRNIPVPRYTEDKLSGNQSYCPIVC